MKHKLNCILLVDDDEGANFLSHAVIKDADCAVHIKTEQKAKAALDYITDSAQLTEKKNPLPFPDLILLDIYMPAMDAWDFLREYKELKNKLSHTPVIIIHTLSRNPHDTLKAKAIREVSDIFEKPMTTELINSIVSKYFPHHL